MQYPPIKKAFKRHDPIKPEVKTCPKKSEMVYNKEPLLSEIVPPPKKDEQNNSQDPFASQAIIFQRNNKPTYWNLEFLPSAKRGQQVKHQISTALNIVNYSEDKDLLSSSSSSF